MAGPNNAWRCARCILVGLDRHSLIFKHLRMLELRLDKSLKPRVILQQFLQPNYLLLYSIRHSINTTNCVFCIYKVYPVILLQS